MDERAKIVIRKETTQEKISNEYYPLWGSEKTNTNDSDFDAG